MGDKPYQWKHHTTGDMMYLEISDYTGRVLHRGRINLGSPSEVENLLAIIQKYSGFNIVRIIQERAKLGKLF